MAGETIPMMLNPTVPWQSPLSIQQQAATTHAIENANIDNVDRRNAMYEYRDRLSAGDPRATDALATQPQAFAQITAARNAMSHEQRQKFDFDLSHRARVAAAVSIYPAGSVERQKAWDDGLKELLQVGALTSGTYQEMVGKPPNDLVLQQYQMLGGLDFIKQAQADMASRRHAANFDASNGAAQAAPVTPQAAASAPQASPAQAAGFAPGPIQTPFGARAAQPPAAAGLVAPAGPASPLRPSASAAPAAPAPVAAPAASSYPAAAEAASPGGAAVTPPADMAATQLKSDNQRLLDQSLSGFGNQRARQQMLAAEAAMRDPKLPDSERKAYEKIYERAAKEAEPTEQQKNYASEMRQRIAVGDPLRPVIPFDEWNKTELLRNYEAYKTDEHRAGRTPKAFEAWHLNTIREASNRPEATLDQELSKGLAKRINDAADDAKEAFNNREVIGRMGAMLERSGTGAQVAFANWVKNNLGENVALLFGKKEDLSAAEAADALVNYLKPRMRVAGTGASSDKDLVAFGAAIPNLMSTTEGKRLIVETLGGIYQRSMDVGQIAMSVQSGDISPKEFDKKVRELRDPFSSFKEWQQSEHGRAGKAPPDIPVFDTLDDAKKAAAANQIRTGSKYRLKDGSIGEVP